LTLRVGVLSHSSDFTPSGAGAALLTPQGWSQNWFSAANTSGTRRSLSVTWDRANISAFGSHAFSLSTDLRQRVMTGSVAHQPIEIEDSAGRLVRSIAFGPSAGMSA